MIVKKLEINPIRRSLILEDLKMITIDSNEAERSTAVIGDLVKAVVAAMLDAGLSAKFKAQNIYYDNSKKDFITDYELYTNQCLFHIVEAKGSTGLSGAKEQIRQQLIKSGCMHGCITDGFTWQFVSLKDNEIHLVGTPLLLELQIDTIFNNITKTISS